MVTTAVAKPAEWWWTSQLLRSKEYQCRETTHPSSLLITLPRSSRARCVTERTLPLQTVRQTTCGLNVSRGHTRTLSTSVPSVPCANDRCTLSRENVPPVSDEALQRGHREYIEIPDNKALPMATPCERRTVVHALEWESQCFSTWGHPRMERYSSSTGGHGAPCSRNLGLAPILASPAARLLASESCYRWHCTHTSCAIPEQDFTSQALTNLDIPMTP